MFRVTDVYFRAPQLESVILTRASVRTEHTKQEISSWTQSAQWKLSVPHTREQECGDKPRHQPAPRLLFIAVIEKRGTTEPKQQQRNDKGCFHSIIKKVAHVENVTDESLHPDNFTPSAHKDLWCTWFIHANLCICRSCSQNGYLYAQILTTLEEHGEALQGNLHNDQSNLWKLTFFLTCILHEKR